MSLLCGILSKRGFGVATKETSYNGAIIEVTWQLYQRTVVVKVNKSLRTARRHHHKVNQISKFFTENQTLYPYQGMIQKFCNQEGWVGGVGQLIMI